MIQLLHQREEYPHSTDIQALSGEVLGGGVGGVDGTMNISLS